MTKEFHLSDILSITTGRLVSTRHIEGVYDILGYMTGESLFTHQLPRAAKVGAPIILAQYPQLSDIDADSFGPENWREWLDQQVARFGEALPIEPIPPGQWRRIDPIQEMTIMTAGKPVTVVIAGEKE